MSDIPLGTLMAYAGPVFYRNTTNFDDVSEEFEEEFYNLGIKNGESLAQKGWLLADGSRFSPFDSQVGDLNFVLQFGWGGQGAPATYFRVPDLQGVFVRGVSNANSTKDPDAVNRVALYERGNTGYGVGSYQGDTIQQHVHNETSSTVVDMRYAGHSRGNMITRPTGGTTSGVQNAKVSTETRPKNVYVHWIVKASDSPIDLDKLYLEQEKLTNEAS